MDRLNPGPAAPVVSPDCELPPALAPDTQPGDLGDEGASRERVSRIVQTIEADIIPRLVRAHRPPAAQPAVPAPVVIDGAVIARFVSEVLADGDAAWSQTVAELRERGASIDTIYLDLLAPTARQLGSLWEDDEVLFSDVTVAVGRLQRVMRSLSRSFGTEVDHPADGRRALLLPAPGEQHTFGLSMVSEFFRRAGWDVVCDLDSRALDPVSLVRSEWFDVIGFSAGAEARIDWLKSGIAAVRQASRNRAIGVMVGGPIFASNPARVAEVGADATAPDGRRAPAAAEQLLDERARRL